MFQRWFLWPAVALVGAFAFGWIALKHGETINAAWLVTAAVCCYALGYRFYSKLIAERIFALDDRRTTPAVRLEDGHDHVPTGKWVVFGHHFAAIAGAGPLVGPILAAQFGWLPGTIWIIVGVVLGGAVQDLVILCGSLRHDGRSLGQLAREHIGPVAGWTAMIAMLGIVLLLIAVLAIVVVNAMAESPWSVATIGLTIPIALLMGVWMRWIRPGRTLEASLIGLVLLGVALWLGKLAASHQPWATWFHLSKVQLAWAIIVYGFVAAVLPVWLLLAPRDYLSAFVKIGVVVALAVGVLIVMPELQMPALISTFADGTDVAGGHGPVFAGSVFPFAFITIACGAISGFHALVSSGTTPKLIARETDARAIGYGAMLMESAVAIMALIAACALTPGLYFAMNSAQFAGKDLAMVATTVTSWGFALTPQDLTKVAQEIGETSVVARTGGAPTLAVGMAQLFDRVTSALGWTGLKALWYHFAILFEALFILTTIDAGTRVARFMLQNLAGAVWAPLGRVAWQPVAWLAAALVVAGWGFFLYTGVTDPNGVKFIWPVFGIANQTLAAIALCVATTLIIGMGKARWAWITLMPLAFLLLITQWASYERIFSPDPLLGFIAQIRMLETKLLAPEITAAAIATANKALFNARLDLVLVIGFTLAVWIVLISSLSRWWSLLRRGGTPTLAPLDPAPVQIPHLGFVASLRQWSGDDAYERHCAAHVGHDHPLPSRGAFYRDYLRRRSERPRCC